jgi:hypothetical protein
MFEAGMAFIQGSDPGYAVVKSHRPMQTMGWFLLCYHSRDVLDMHRDVAQTTKGSEREGDIRLTSIAGVSVWE